MAERVVYKYQLGSADISHVEVPVGSRPVLFAAQRGDLCVWIDQPCDTALSTEVHEFLIRGTGHPYSAVGWRHIDSTLVDDGQYVFHLYGRVI